MQHQSQLLDFWKAEIVVWEGDACLQEQTPCAPTRVQVQVGTIKQRTAMAG